MYVKRVSHHVETLMNAFMEIAFYGINFEICHKVVYAVRCSLYSLLMLPTKIA